MTPCTPLISEQNSPVWRSPTLSTPGRPREFGLVYPLYSGTFPLALESLYNFPPSRFPVFRLVTLLGHNFIAGYFLVTFSWRLGLFNRLVEFLPDYLCDFRVSPESLPNRPPSPPPPPPPPRPTVQCALCSSSPLLTQER